MDSPTAAGRPGSRDRVARFIRASADPVSPVAGPWPTRHKQNPAMAERSHQFRRCQVQAARICRIRCWVTSTSKSGLEFGDEAIAPTFVTMASLKLPLEEVFQGDERIGHARIAARLVSQAIAIHLRHLGVR